MPTTNVLKTRFAAGEPMIGCWVTLASPAVTEALAHCGFDWLVIDTEHGPGDTMDVAAQLRAVDAARANGAKAQSIVRVTHYDPSLVKRAMDCGAQTLIFPSMNTAEQAESAVQAMMYPESGKNGIRGVAGMVRAGDFGVNTSYLKEANSQASAIALIETVEGVRNVDAIAAVSGIDCLMIGTLDLSANMGLIGQTSHPDVLASAELIIAAAKKHSKAVSMFAAKDDDLSRFQEMGVNVLSLNSDVGLLVRGANGAIAAAIKVQKAL